MVVIKYKKKDEGIFFSHLNLIRIWTRIMAIAGIDVADSAPHARQRKMVFSGPTSVGVESHCEYLMLNIDIGSHEVENAIKNILPSWLEVEKVWEITEKLQFSGICAAEYKISFDDYKSCKDRIKNFFAQDEIKISAMVHGKPEVIDVKDRVFGLKLEDEDFKLITGIGNNSARIVELIKALMANLKSHGYYRIKKVNQFVKKDEKLVSFDEIIKQKSKY